MIDVDGNLFAVVARFASTETETRSYICGVRVEPYPGGGALLIATDGHRLIVARDATGKCSTAQTVRLPTKVVRGIKPVLGAWPRVTVASKGFVRVGAVYASRASVIVKERYPLWRECVPVRVWRNVPSNFNPQYLISFAKAAQMLGGSAISSLRVIGGESEGDAALILFSQCENAFGILMPVKCAAPKGALPLWMKPVMRIGKTKRKARR